MSAFFFRLALCGAIAGAGSAPAAPTVAAAPAAPALQVPDQAKAESLVDVVYNTWRLSLIRGNESAWITCTPRSRRVKVRNMIVSQRGRFPSDFFAQPHEMPPLENFRYVGALLGCGGRTLAATYLGRVQLGEKNFAADNAYVILMVHEEGRWRIDQTRFFNLSKLPEVRKRLAAKDINVLKEQDGFHPYDRLPSTPPSCPAPELIGKVFVDAPGRNVKMTINGISLHEFDDERRADIISGGLRRGRNTITYHITTDDAKSHPSLGIGLFVMPETPGNHPMCVFDHILDSTDTAHGGTFEFFILNDHIAAMNPKFKGTPPQPFHAVPLKEKPKK